MQKTHELAVKTGEYTDRDGNVKGRWENVGSLWDDGKGGQFITIKATFNPAGVPRREGKDQILVSLFEPREQGQGQGQPQRGQPQRGQPQPPAQQQQGRQNGAYQGGRVGDGFGDDIPF